MTLDAEGFPLYDSLDAAIVMHRDAHFGGNFSIMIDYYEKGGRGVQEEFSIERIKELQKIEETMGQNLAAILLSGPEAERVAEAKAAYKKLKDLYEAKEKQGNETLKYPKLIADLILTEEEEPFEEVQIVVKEKSAIVPALLKVLQSENYYDPLFPGYGLAPELVTKCLGKIADKRAIISLFESIGEHDFMQESSALDALKAIGIPARDFLLHVLHAKPITYDNERAAMALLQFSDDPVVVNTCFNMLKELDLKKYPILAGHLILTCEKLTDKKEQKELLTLSEIAPSSLKSDFKAISSHWK